VSTDKFKVGDRVICIRTGNTTSSHTSPLVIGNTYVIAKISKEDDEDFELGFYLEGLEEWVCSSALFKLESDVSEAANFWDNVSE
jgi:hypothetical protein